jgi:zinc finger BED domain-containing protein 1 (E3 SUMO-protein ligase ZBED1)
LPQINQADEDEEDFYAILMGHGQANIDQHDGGQELDDIPVEDKVKAEIAHYRALPFLAGKKVAEDGKIIYANPLEWWKSHEVRLPLLSRLARRVLCIPATSAPSERVFSAAGLTIANRRAALNAENAAALIFLHDSWPEVERIESAMVESNKRK